MSPYPWAAVELCRAEKTIQNVHPAQGPTAGLGTAAEGESGATEEGCGRVEEQQQALHHSEGRVRKDSLVTGKLLAPRVAAHSEMAGGTCARAKSVMLLAGELGSWL